MPANNNKNQISQAELRELKKMYFVLSLEWDTEANGAIPSRDNIPDIAYKYVKWKCMYCGKKWEDQICNRLRGEKPCGCVVEPKKDPFDGVDWSSIRNR